MPYQIQVKQVESQTTAVVRCRAKQSDLPKVIPQACGEVWAFVRSANFPRPGRNLALYLDSEMNLEVGVEVSETFAGNGRVVCSSTPAGTVATAVHWGPYVRLGEAHEAIHKLCTERGHTMAGPSWEVYGHWYDEPGLLRTDVLYLLQAAAEAPG
jgi:effector-binding domain-containing protein